MALDRSQCEISDVPDFENHVKLVIQRIRDAMAEMFVSVGADPLNPQDVARRFGLNRNLTWKISKVIRENDPSVSIPNMPGRSGLDIFIKRFEKAGASAESVASVQTALTEFDQMVNVHSGDRETLEMMLGGLTRSGDDQQQLFEMQRKLSFRGNSATWGVQARVQIAAHFIAPSEEPEMLDVAIVSGLVDFRRLRRDVPWAIASLRAINDDGSLKSPETIEALDPNFSGPNTPALMGKFCSQPIPELRVAPGSGGVKRFELAEGPVGNTAVVTCVTGWCHRRTVSRYRTDANSLGELFVSLSTPVGLLIHDMFVHRDLTEAMTPTLSLYGQLPGGPIYPLAGRERGLLPAPEGIIHLGGEPPNVVTPEVPRYRHLVRAVFDRLGRKAEHFHGFRFKMRYPPIPALGVFRYELPVKTS